MKLRLSGKLAAIALCLLTLIIQRPYMGLSTSKHVKVEGISASKELPYLAIEKALQPAFAEEKPAKILVAGAQTKKATNLPKVSAPPQINVAIQAGHILALIEKYAAQYGVSKEIMISIAKCESGLNPSALGKGIYAGLFQFTASTWTSNRRAMGTDPNPALRFDAEEAAKTAAFKMARDGFSAWPSCSRKITQAL